jgi:hypothetical protein
MKIDLAIREVGRSEAELADLLLRVVERHRVEHDVFHMSRTLAAKSRESLLALTDAAARYDVALDLDAAEPSDGLRTALREKSAELLAGRPQAAALLLLRDLREVHLRAAEASINWVILGQGAQAVRDEDLLGTVAERHPFALKTLKWTTTRLKEAAPQVLAS